MNNTQANTTEAVRNETSRKANGDRRMWATIFNSIAATFGMIEQAAIAGERVATAASERAGIIENEARMEANLARIESEDRYNKRKLELEAKLKQLESE